MRFHNLFGRVVWRGKVRGQMEIMGLVVIVILVSLGMLFMVKFALDDTHDKKIFTRKGLAYSTVSAVMKETVSDQSCFADGIPRLVAIGSELFDDCSLYFGNYDTLNDRSDQGFSLYQCGGLHSCAFLKDHISERLESTLGKWNKKYTFESSLVSPASRSSIFTITSTMGGCSAKGTDKDSSGIYPLSNLQGGEVQNILFICD